MSDDIIKDAIRAAVMEKYNSVGRDTPEDIFQYKTGADGARHLGYEERFLQNIPQDVLEGFCGVGNPFEPRNLKPGNRVLEIGCGAGVDSIIACHQIEPQGEFVGIDLSDGMLKSARNNFLSIDLRSVSLSQATGEALPFANNKFDVVISNGVFNLCPEKGKLFQEIYDVLASGGHLQFADVILEQGDKPPRTSPKYWAG